MLNPVGKKWNDSIDPLPETDQANTAFIESPQDNFELIFRLLGKALKCIRKYQLREINKLGVDAIQKNYEEIAHEIRGIKKDDTRLTQLVDRFDALVKAPLDALSKSEGYVKLCGIYSEFIQIARHPWQVQRELPR